MLTKMGVSAACNEGAIPNAARMAKGANLNNMLNLTDNL